MSDRADVVARAILQLIALRLVTDPIIRGDVVSYLRDEFADIKREDASEIRLTDG